MCVWRPGQVRLPKVSVQLVDKLTPIIYKVDGFGNVTRISCHHMHGNSSER